MAVGTRQEPEAGFVLTVKRPQLQDQLQLKLPLDEVYNNPFHSLGSSVYAQAKPKILSRIEDNLPSLFFLSLFIYFERDNMNGG